MITAKFQDILLKFHILEIEFLHEKILFFGLFFFPVKVSDLLLAINPPLVADGCETRGGLWLDPQGFPRNVAKQGGLWLRGGLWLKIALIKLKAPQARKFWHLKHSICIF